MTLHGRFIQKGEHEIQEGNSGWVVEHMADKTFPRALHLHLPFFIPNAVSTADREEIMRMAEDAIYCPVQEKHAAYYALSPDKALVQHETAIPQGREASLKPFTELIEGSQES